MFVPLRPFQIACNTFQDVPGPSALPKSAHCMTDSKLAAYPSVLNNTSSSLTKGCVYTG